MFLETGRKRSYLITSQKRIYQIQNLAQVPKIPERATMDYGTPKAMKCQSELQLPAWKNYIQLLTQLRWDPQDILGMLSLEVKKDKLSRKWTGEVVAMKNIGKHRDLTKSIAYNYSLFALTEEDGKWTSSLIM
ncbi:hypothetical protein ACTXT7_005913 [Hymenolepis weldensis]